MGLNDLDAGRREALHRRPADRPHLGLERRDPEVVAPGDPARELGRRAAERNGSGGAGSASGSSGCGPAIASSMSAASATSRAIGPSTVSVSNGCSAGPRAIRPGDGRRPTTEQNDAGVRRLPPRSEPVASQTCLVASATAEPPEEPPHVRLVSHGFRVGPNTSLKVCPPAPNSGVFDLATTTAPRSSRCSTTMSERSGTLSA